MPTKHHNLESQIIKSGKEGLFSFLASTEKTDSDGDIVVQEGIDLSRFNQNPIILYEHDRKSPIGKASNVALEQRGLVADIELAPRGISEKIDTVRGLMGAGILKAVSIGFSALEYEPIYNQDNKFTGYKFLKSLLHEISVVAIPANQEALSIARSFGLSKSQMHDVFRNCSSFEKKIQNENKVRVLKLINGNHYGD